MADISEFNINDTLYNLKDNQARNDIESISSNLNNYLPLSGGTVTNSIFIKENNYDCSTSGTVSSDTDRGLLIRDTNNKNMVYYIGRQKTNGDVISMINARRMNGTAAVNNYIYLKVANNNTKSVELSDPEEWRIALGSNSNGIWPIELGGTGATSRTTAIKSLFQSNVGTSTTHVLSIYSDWSKAGYVSVQELRNQMGLGNTLEALPIENGGTGATTRVGPTGAVHNLFAENVGTSTNYFLTLYSSGSGWQKAGYASLATAWSALGGGDLGKLDSLAIGGLSNAWTGTLSSGATKSFSLISAATAAVIFWVRSTTFGVAATSGYSNDGMHIIFDSGTNSPTFSGTGTSFSIKNNRDAVIYLIVLGAIPT